MKLLDKPQIRKATKELPLKSVGIKVAYLLCSFILSVSQIDGASCPFAVALVSVSDKTNIVFSAIGAMLGYAITGGSLDAPRYFTSVIIAALGAFAISLFKLKKEPSLPMIISALSVLATGIVMTFRCDGASKEYLVSVGQAVLAAGATFFFFKTVNSSIRRLRFKAAPLTDVTCVIICSSIILMSLGRISVGGIVPARIVAVLIILICLRYGNAIWGITAALGTGFSLSLTSKGAMFLLGAYAFSALLASLFTNLASFGCAVAFTVSMSFFAINASLGKLSICTVAESFIAGVILVLLPEVVGDKIEEFFNDGADIAPEGSLRQSLVVRLRFASSAMASISESVRDVKEKIDKINNHKGIIGDPVKSDLRMVASEQFFSISDMLSDLAFEFDEAECFDSKSAAKIRRMLGESEIYPKNISALVDRYDRMRIEIITEGKTIGLDSSRIKANINRICARNFEKGHITKFNNETLLSFTEKPNYKLSIGYAQYSAEGNICGDTIKIINDSKGHNILIISDGMGRGARAALDGAMGAGLLSKLLCAGFGFDSSLKVVNSALLVKSDDESLATLDCVSVDLFTGKCEFYKAGAPHSYIIKNSNISKCELSSMPAGILRGIEFAKRTTILSRGDTIIMMSDGVADAGDTWLDAFIKYGDSAGENDLAKAIVEFAKKHTEDGHRDDMSVIVAKLMLN